MADSPWPVIHAERRALADDLDRLDDEQWRTPSLCRGWTVLDTLGHMLATATMTPPKFVGHLARSGFRFRVMAARDVAAATAGGAAATLAAWRDNLDRTSAPPGPVDSWLGETLVHAEDIRHPLGVVHAYPTSAVVRALDFYKTSNLIVGTKRRIHGLTLVATDATWTHGSGPTVTGPAHSLLMAATGRAAALTALSGDGVALLRSRLG